MKQIFILTIAILFSATSFTQDNWVKDRWNFKLAYARYPEGVYSPHYSYWENGTRRLRYEINYGFFKYLELGGYFTLAKYGYPANAQILPNGSYQYQIIDNYKLHYGLNCNFHILPLLIKAKDFRFDLYCAGKFGGISMKLPDNSYITQSSVMEYDVAAGLAFYPFKHVGLYTEYGYGKFVNLRFGLSMKFR